MRLFNRRRVATAVRYAAVGTTAGLVLAGAAAMPAHAEADPMTISTYCGGAYIMSMSYRYFEAGVAWHVGSEQCLAGQTVEAEIPAGMTSVSVSWYVVPIVLPFDTDSLGVATSGGQACYSASGTLLTPAVSPVSC